MCREKLLHKVYIARYICVYKCMENIPYQVQVSNTYGRYNHGVVTHSTAFILVSFLFPFTNTYQIYGI